MKKLLLFVMAVMAFAGMSMAQTVYTAGTYTNDYDNSAAVVFQNGTVLYQTSSEFAKYTCTDVVVDSDGHVYWVENYRGTSGNYWGNINLDGDTFLDNILKTRINALALDKNDNLYSAGYYENTAGIQQAAVWKNDNSSPYALFGDGMSNVIATGIVCDGNDIYTCGYKYWDATFDLDYHGYVWKNDELEPIISLEHVEIIDIAYSEGEVFVLGSTKVDDYYVAKLYRYADGETNEVLEVSVDNYSMVPEALEFDCANYYYTAVSSDESFTSNNKLWKNGNVFTVPSNATHIKGLDVTPDGVYYTVTTGTFLEGRHTAVYKDGVQLWAPEQLEWVESMFVVPAACDNEVRTLPYFEGFEIGATDWTCWLTGDDDDQNEGNPSYWQRIGERMPFIYAPTGDYCAIHEDGPEGVPQEGWLVSPLIRIPEGGNAVKLTFKTFEKYEAFYEYEGVWVASEGFPDGLQVWTASDDFVSEEWKEVTVDLSAYKGLDIRVAFKYTGTYAHIWYVDDVSIEQEAGPGYYTITTLVDPVGAGTVEGGNTYPAGETVYLNAIPNSGWTFSHWQDGITTNPRSITVTENATYTAFFLQENYTITVNAIPAEGGSISGGGSYHYGDMVTLTANANSGYTFVSWSDGDTNNPRNVTVTGNATYTAFFNSGGSTMYTVTVSSNNLLLGTVSGTGTYPEGAVITISAEPSPNARFVSWDDGNTDNPREVTVTSNLSFTAIFAALQHYTITVESSNTTMGTVSGGGNFLEGTEIEIKAEPFAGYYFTSWDDGNADNPRTITVTQDATYKAIFSTSAVQTYTLTVMCNTVQGSVIGSGTYAAGSTVTIAAVPNSGFEFDKWSDDNTQNPRQVTVNENIIFVAFFKATGVGENEGKLMVLYPNPANNYIRIEGLEANSEVKIYNTMGALVKVVNANDDEEINIGDLASGLYMVRCGNATLRFVKE